MQTLYQVLGKCLTTLCSSTDICCSLNYSETDLSGASRDRLSQNTAGVAHVVLRDELSEGEVYYLVIRLLQHAVGHNLPSHTERTAGKKRAKQKQRDKETRSGGDDGGGSTEMWTHREEATMKTVHRVLRRRWLRRRDAF